MKGWPRCTPVPWAALGLVPIHCFRSCSARVLNKAAPQLGFHLLPPPVVLLALTLCFLCPQGLSCLAHTNLERLGWF